MRTRDKAGGQRRRLRTLVLGATLVLALCAFTAPAGAAVIGVTQKCFVNSNPDQGRSGVGDRQRLHRRRPGHDLRRHDGRSPPSPPPTARSRRSFRGPVLTTPGAGKQTYTLTAQD